MTTSSFWVNTEDWHTAGEPFRIVPDLPPHCLTEGTSVAKRLMNVLSTPDHSLDFLRRSLCHGPRGHADMYGGFIVPGNDDRAHFEVLFWHKDGFSTACGYGSIALAYWAIAKDIVKPSKNGVVDVIVDLPSGRVVAQFAMREGESLHVDFVNVSGYQIAKQVPVDLGFAQLKVDLSFGGAVLASVDVNNLGEEMHVESRNYERFISLGRHIKALLGSTAHYGDYDLASVCFFETERRQ